MKTIKSVIVIMVMLLTLCTILPVGTVSATDILGKIEGQSDYKNDAEEPVTNILTAIIAIVRIVAVGVAIIILVILAIKYMSAAPGDKADIKKHAVIYVVGAIVLFATSGILTILENFSKNIK